MRLDLFLLADAATGAEGKLYVHGGGLTELYPSRLPWHQPQIAVVFRLQLERGDDQRDHELIIRVLGPNERPLGPDLRAPVERASLPAFGEVPRYVQGAITLGHLRFAELGEHRFELIVDGERMRSEPIIVTDRHLEQQ